MDQINEQLLNAWIEINAFLKDSSMTKNLTYNQAIIMEFLLEQYKNDGIGKLSYKVLIEKTNFVKSLINRTIDQLCEINYVTKIKEGKNAYVQIVETSIEAFLKIHNNSLKICNKIIDEIGLEAAKTFVKICDQVKRINRKELLD